MRDDGTAWVWFCWRCRREGRPWLLPTDCPHWWLTADDTVKLWLARVRRKSTVVNVHTAEKSFKAEVTPRGTARVLEPAEN